jgi:hypothetical protein
MLPAAWVDIQTECLRPSRASPQTPCTRVRAGGCTISMLSIATIMA